MTLFSFLRRLLILAPLALGLSGCIPGADGPVDEEKDPYFLAGKSRLSSMEYDSAAVAFENALLSNPKSASAHLELGLLYEEKKANYAAAIYHYQKHLELRPESNMADTVKLHIYSCTLELGKTVQFALVSRSVADEMRRLNTTNIVLHEQISLLKTQLVEQAVAYNTKLAALMQTSALTAPKPAPAAPAPERRSTPPERAAPPPAVVAYTLSRAMPTPSSHLVKGGETMASIARRYNIRLSSLQSANPGIDARRLKAGQILNLPSSRN